MNQPGDLSQYYYSSDGELKCIINLIDGEVLWSPASPIWKAIDEEEDNVYYRKEELRKLLSMKKRTAEGENDRIAEVMDMFDEYVLDRLARREMLVERMKALLDQEYKDMPISKRISILSSVGETIHMHGAEESKRALYFKRELEKLEEVVVVVEELSPYKRRRLCY